MSLFLSWHTMSLRGSPRGPGPANSPPCSVPLWCKLLGSIDDREHVILAHDHQLLAVELDLGAGVAGEDDLVAFLDVERGALAVVEAAGVADGPGLATLGLLLGGVGEHDAALGLALGFQPLDQDLVGEGTKLCHVWGLLLGTRTL